MKNPLFLLLYVLGSLGLCMTLIACASQAQLDAGHALAAALVSATDPNGPGGAMTTPDEQANIEALYGALKGAEGLDWKQVGAGALGALGAFIPALRYLPNSLIIGKQEAAHLDKASGVSQ